MGRLVCTSFQRAGRLIPSTAGTLRARSVVLAPGQAMAWHSTKDREELLFVTSGAVQFETQRDSRRVRRRALRAGQCVFVPSQTMHQVVNRSNASARYVYVTAPIR